MRTFATGAAVIAAAMKNKPSVPLSSADKQPGLLAQGMRGFAAVLRKVFLPHLLAGMGLFLSAAYVSYQFCVAPLRLPGLMELAAAGVLFGVYGITAFLYSLLAACAFSVRSACVAWEEFIDKTVDQVKENIALRIENMNEGLAKDQAKVLVSGSVREVMRSSGKRELKGFPHWLAAVFLGVVTLALRSVLIARIVKISGTTVKLGKLFAGKAAIAGAVFLNLRLFSTLFLMLIYAFGIFILAVNFLFVFWIK